MLQSERLVLREFLDRDFEAVHAYASDLEVVRYLEWGPYSEAETRGFIERAQAHSSEDPRSVFELAVIEVQTNGLVGSIGLHTKDSQAMLGYCFSRSAWGKGYATEAARLIADFGFQALGVQKIWAGCDSQNASSLRVLEKLGMRRDPHSGRDCQIRGEWRTIVFYGIAADEWKGRSAGDSL
jgi:ribosomal-protein-alanine N-acetyltransferase